jgi:medium-chain acyl-[acyl-carrier-protein] hydrolase
VGMNSIPSTWRELRTVESYEIDMKGRLKPHVLFAYMLNSAWKHTQDTAWGYRPLLAQNLMWVLVKFQLSISRLPVWGEAISLETWGKGTERFYALRDFSVRSPAGERIASATSAWMVLERSSYRPQKLDRMRESFPWEPGRNEKETDLRKVPEPANEVECALFQVSFTDIDVNKHVTATRYLQWILDSYPFSVQEEKELESAEISFLAEATLGDQVSVGRETNGDHDLCRIMRVGDKKELCRARMGWNGNTTKAR